MDAILQYEENANEEYENNSVFYPSDKSDGNSVQDEENENSG
jgi:hypothetical protein